MWILNFLPTWIAYAITAIGVAGLVISFFTGLFTRFFPTLHAVKFPLQILSTAIALFGVYLWGGISNQEMWEGRVKAMEEKVAVAEEKAKTANSKIEYKYIDRVKVVKDVQIVVKEKIVEVEKIIDGKCEIAPEAVEILNMAAKNPLPSNDKHQDKRELKALKNTKESAQ